MSQIDRKAPVGRRWGTAPVATLAAPGRAVFDAPLLAPWLGRGGWTPARMLERTLDAISTWRERVRMRRQLLLLDERLLRDIGITRLEARSEAEKPFWRI